MFNEKELKLNFISGARSVTGSNFLIEIGNKRFLVDCGLEQGSRFAEEDNYAPFSYDPATIDALIVTHGHLDHVGRIPKLVRDGFRGVIYSTPPTFEIGKLIMVDSMKILTKEAEQQGLEPIYTEQDVAKAVSLWQTREYHEPFFFDCGQGEVSVTLRDAGHILGSSMIEFMHKGTKIVFSGDLGNSPSILLPDTEKLTDIDYLIIESVYGDRNHETHDERREKLKQVLLEASGKQGTLVIPAFSVERTQEILFEMNEMVESGEVPRIPVFLDSPLAIAVTEVFKTSQNYFNKDARKKMRSDDIFDFPGLSLVRSSEESKALRTIPGPKIIIAGSGMMNGGRVMHHAFNYLQDPNSTFLIIGYQAPGTLGRMIVDGLRHVKVFGEMLHVRAQVRTINGYSAHKDSDSLVDFVEPMIGHLKKIFVVLGEPKSSFFLAQRFVDMYGVEVVVPEKGDVVALPFKS